MDFTKESLNLENGLDKEWLITNGIGGYSSSTIIGANTRKYHGLLVASLTPPARRFLILSKLARLEMRTKVGAKDLWPDYKDLKVQVKPIGPLNFYYETEAFHCLLEEEWPDDFGDFGAGDSVFPCRLQVEYE